MELAQLVLDVYALGVNEGAKAAFDTQSTLVWDDGDIEVPQPERPQDDYVTADVVYLEALGEQVQKLEQRADSYERQFSVLVEQFAALIDLVNEGFKSVTGLNGDSETEMHCDCSEGCYYWPC